MTGHVLVCTDGSPRAAKGVREGLRLARALGARVTGVYVIAPSPADYGERSYYFGGFTAATYRKYTEHAADKALAALVAAGRRARVPCTTRKITDAQPWRGILRAARAARCDLIVMSSHGRGALGGLILGSETMHVLAHGKIPVLVVR